MKKTIRINIGGLVFNIDEDAYQKLRDYLNALNKRFSATAEGNEIIDDIESRIGDLFLQKTDDLKQVITLEDVEEIISIMGDPQEIDDESDENQDNKTKREKGAKRMYRDPDNRVLGGVCAGISHYLGIDPIIMRALFIILFFAYGVTFFVYILLWIVIPVAQTTAQKLEMRGKKVNVSTSERAIREEFEYMRKNFNEFRHSQRYQNSKDALQTFLRGVASLLTIITKILIVVIGVLLIISSVTMIAAITGSFFMGDFFIPIVTEGLFHGTMDYFFTIFGDRSITQLGFVALYFVIIIPLLALIFIGTKMAFRYKSNNLLIGLSSLGVWIVSLGIFSFSAFSIATDFKMKGTITNEEIINYQQSDTLYLDILPNDEYIVEEPFIDMDDCRITMRNDEPALIGIPKFDIEKSRNGQIMLEIKKHSRGETRLFARENAQEIIYNWQMKDSVLLLDTYFYFPDNVNWRNQQLEINLKLPEGKAVYLHPALEDIIYDIENVENMWDYDMLGKMWVMKPGGLTRTEALIDTIQINDSIHIHTDEKPEKMEHELDSIP